MCVTHAMRRREMHGIVSEPCKRLQRLRPIEISPQRRNTEPAQHGEVRRAVREPENTAAAPHLRDHVQRYVGAGHNE